MSVIVRRLIRNMKKEYHVNLLAGADGLDNKVQWVHMIEDCKVAEFLRGQELIITTGIGNIQDKGIMLEFVSSLHKKQASGVMFNLGPYISNIPRSVVDYCNEVRLPLLTIPWEVRLVDLTRGFCQILFESEEKERSLTSMVKDFIFKPEGRELLYSDLTRSGFAEHLNYCILNIGIMNQEYEKTREGEMEWLYEVIEREASRMLDHYTIFKNEQRYILVLAGLNTTNVKKLVEHIIARNNMKDTKIIVGASTNRENLKELPANYMKSKKVYKLAWNLNRTPVFFDDLNLYKILLSVEDEKVIGDYKKKILDSIIEYDQANDSDYFCFIRLYLENGASVQQVASAMYVHRNTIHYKIKKIKEIWGINLSDINDLLIMKLSISIYDMLKK